MNNKFRNNAFLGPINSWMFKMLSGYMNYLFGKSKRELFKHHPKTVVEIGPGAGANMRYFAEGTHLIAVEPNVHMHKNLRKSANKYRINLEIRPLVVEAVDLPDNSIDLVICTLVLCTVSNPIKCVEQIKRILKPSGTFAFIEHVKGKENTLIAVIQKIMYKPWHWFFEGCHTNRDTKTLLEQAGFSSLNLEEYNSYSPFIPIIPQIRGRAVK